MPRVFPHVTNTIARASFIGVLLPAAGVLWACLVYARSPYGTGAGVMRDQPVPFSHEHHAGRLEIDCRYCHEHVERAPYAGMPPTKTCMNCHSQIWLGSDVLEPVRRSYRDRRPLRWQRVNNMPGFVYFDHSVHVQNGIGCSSCHGRIDQMPLTYQVPSLLMEWCLDCHRRPEEHLRPRADVFDMHWSPPPDQRERGRALAAEYQVPERRLLTSCTTCHR
jgi:hypothetical protein